MNTFSFLLAWRYIRGAWHTPTISSMVKICCMGISVGTFALALVTAIKNGFDVATYTTMQTIHAQISMRSHGQPLNVPAIEKVITKEFPQVASLSPTALGQVIIQTEDTQDITNVIALKAINAAREMTTTDIAKKIVQPKNADLSSLLQKNGIILGAKLAKELNITLNQQITLIYAQEKSRTTMTFATQKATVVGFFSTGIEEFDMNLALCSFAFFDALFPETGITQINMRLHPHTNEEKLMTKLQKRFNVDVYSWKELYPALMAALKLEKYALFLVLALITLIASMNIISLLFMQILQKKGDIAILRAMGFSDTDIRLTFVCMGIIIAGIASIIGLSIAILASWLLQRYPLITLPDIYYTGHLPIVMDWHIIAITFIFVLIVALIATWISVYRTRFNSIAHILRFDA